MGDGLGGVWRGPPVVAGRGPALHAGFGPCYAGMLLTPAEARAAAANFYAWGADGISFWNIACSIGTRGKQTGEAHRQRMFAWMAEAADRAAVARGPRCYHYLPLYKGMETHPGNHAVHLPFCSPHGAPKTATLEFNAASQGARLLFPFRTADGRNGEPVRGVLRFRALHCPARNPFLLDINGIPLKVSAVGDAPDPANLELSARWFSLDLADAPPLRGDNELGLTWSGPLNVPATWVEELEITVETTEDG